MSATGKAVLLKFNSLQENYIKSVLSLYFQGQFSKLKWTKKTKKAIKSALKGGREEKVLSPKKNKELK